MGKAGKDLVPSPATDKAYGEFCRLREGNLRSEWPPLWARQHRTGRGQARMGCCWHSSRRLLSKMASNDTRANPRTSRLYFASDATPSISISMFGLGSATTTQVVRAG